MKNKKEKRKVQPKGGELYKADIVLKTQEQHDKEVDVLLKSYPHLNREQVRLVYEKNILTECWVNTIYQVLVYRGEDADELIHEKSLKGKCTYLSIKRRDKRPVNNWQDMQTIKNRLCGTETDAIQIFPKESRMINQANQYHLIVFPYDYYLPFGWHGKRIVMTDDREGGEHTSAQVFKGEVV